MNEYAEQAIASLTLLWLSVPECKSKQVKFNIKYNYLL